MSNFIFYDFETSSSNKYWGQIIQIGAVLTNDKLDELDRFEKEDLNFHENIRRAYLDLAKKNSERIVLFDSLISEDELFEMAINLIESRISE